MKPDSSGKYMPIVSIPASFGDLPRMKLSFPRKITRYVAEEQKYCISTNTLRLLLIGKLNHLFLLPNSPSVESKALFVQV